MKTTPGSRSYPGILTGRLQLGPYPMERLRRVETPTTRITDSIARFDSRQTGFAMARRGELGEIGSLQS